MNYLTKYNFNVIYNLYIYIYIYIYMNYNIHCFVFFKYGMYIFLFSSNMQGWSDVCVRPWLLLDPCCDGGHHEQGV